MVLENSYPTTSTGCRTTSRRSCGPPTPGQETGHALADVLFGDVNPAGRLTQTWYQRRRPTLPDILDYDIIKTGSTYQYCKGAPLYAFGHGLSYTTFGYQGLKRRRVRATATRSSVRVTNTGSRAGDEVVQLYTHQRDVTGEAAGQAAARLPAGAPRAG